MKSSPPTHTFIHFCDAKIKFAKILCAVCVFVASLLVGACRSNVSLDVSGPVPVASSLKMSVPTEGTVWLDFVGPESAEWSSEGFWGGKVTMEPCLSTWLLKEAQKTIPNAKRRDKTVSMSPGDYLTLVDWKFVPGGLGMNVGGSLEISTILHDSNKKTLKRIDDNVSFLSAENAWEEAIAAFTQGFTFFLSSPITNPWIANAKGRDLKKGMHKGVALASNRFSNQLASAVLDAEQMRKLVKNTEKGDFKRPKSSNSTLNLNVDEHIPENPENRSRNIFVAIIANENYRFVAPVNYAKNDGKIFYEYCRKTLGIPENQIRIFTDATLGEMAEALSWLEKRGNLENAELVLYYSGHGIPNDETRVAYLLPTDISPANLDYVKPLNSVYEQLSCSHAKIVSVFLDACFSGMRRDNAPIIAAKGVRRVAPAGDISSLPPNIVVFTAASGDQTAHFAKSKQHGLFTYALLKKLQETRGNITLSELGKYLRKFVFEQSLKLGDFEQHPSILAHKEFPYWSKKLYSEKN